MEKLVEAAEEGGETEVIKTHEFLCGDDAVNMIKSDVSSEGLNKVVVAACSSRFNSDVFNFGDQVFVDRIPLREFVAWSHTERGENGEVDEDTQMLGEDYCRMGVAMAGGALAPTPHVEEDFCKTLLVVGGGVTGLTSAAAAAEAGYDVVIVEKDGELGGQVKKFAGVFPKTPPYREVQPTGMEGLIDRVQSLPNVKIHTSTTVKEIAGQPGQFDVTLKNGSSEAKERIGTIVLASGWNPYPAERLTHLGYGECKNVVTNMDIEAMAKEGAFRRPSDGATPKSVVFIQCAGSRDEDHLPYCSGVCCRVSLKQARYIREKCPDTKVFILYKQVRSPMQYELFYAQTQEDEGIFLSKGEIGSIKEKVDGGVTVVATDTLLGEEIEINADMAVLAAGMTPTTLVEEAGQETAAEAAEDQEAGGEEAEKKEGEEGGEAGGASAEAGARILNLTYRLGTDLPTLKYGFPDSHFICFPYETRRTGIYAAGTVRAPMDIAACTNDAYGATMKAIQCMELMSKGMAVHPRAMDTTWPDFRLTRCTQCKRCTEECPFGSLDEDVKGTPEPNPNRCRRCGVCMGACPERIVSFSNYSVHIIAAIIKAIEIPDEEDEKPRILIFACENDAIPALETVALQRKKYSPMVRIIPVRCLGSMNIVWIAEALSSGFDGVILLGCRHGDDYQCHFIRGSELCETRMGNVKEKLKQLALEEERVMIEEVNIDEHEKLPAVIDAFVDNIEEIGYNPFKGF
jgi:quinone-modifying oxidoreductase subunit QmoB